MARIPLIPALVAAIATGLSVPLPRSWSFLSRLDRRIRRAGSDWTPPCL